MDIKEALKRYFGYKSFRKNQEEIITTAMGGRDTLVLMPTGGGKSLCYQIPAIVMDGTCVVVSPLISLMKDQVEALRANGIPAEALNSTNDFNAETVIRRRCLAGDIKLLYLTRATAGGDTLFIKEHEDIPLRHRRGALHQSVGA